MSITGFVENERQDFKPLDNYVQAADTCPREGVIFLPGRVPLELVCIPPGSFQMGSPINERGRDADEGPVHTVTFATEFYMGKYVVTQAQWLSVMNSWPEKAPSSIFGLGNHYPAYYVSWDDTQKFFAALDRHIESSNQEPLTLRLPSEAEWEYACRAGTRTRFYFGDSLGASDEEYPDGPAEGAQGNRSDYMWYCGGEAAYGTPFYGTKPVGGKLPNAFGLYDMSGNVWEWCQDYRHESYVGAPADGGAWENPPALNRVVRGGGWNYPIRARRSANRGDGSQDYRGNIVGFRVVAVSSTKLR